MSNNYSQAGGANVGIVSLVSVKTNINNCSLNWYQALHILLLFTLFSLNISPTSQTMKTKFQSNMRQNELILLRENILTLWTHLFTVDTIVTTRASPATLPASQPRGTEAVAGDRVAQRGPLALAPLLALLAPVTLGAVCKGCKLIFRLWASLGILRLHHIYIYCLDSLYWETSRLYHIHVSL